MQLEEIDVFIEPNGQVRLEVRGVQGDRCLAITKELERALGGQVTSREMTAEASDLVSDQQAENPWDQQQQNIKPE